MAAAAAAAAAPAAAPADAAAVVLHSDLPAELEAFCISKAAEAFAAKKVEKDQAQFIKHALEGTAGGLWHVVVGYAFGLSVSHENNALILFKIGRANVLAFQTFDDVSLVRKEATGMQVAKRAERKEDVVEDGGAGGDDA